MDDGWRPWLSEGKLVSDSQQEDGSTGVPATCVQLEAGLGFLQEALKSVAAGVTRSFALVEIDAEGRPRKSTMSVDAENLDKLAAVLQEQSVFVSHLASLSQGNAPPASRSNSTH